VPEFAIAAEVRNEACELAFEEIARVSGRHAAE
jgi:hypothetical protein